MKRRSTLTNWGRSEVDDDLSDGLGSGKTCDVGLLVRNWSSGNEGKGWARSVM